MTRDRWSVVVSGFAIVWSTACVSVQRPSFILPAPQRDWPGTLTQAQNQAIAGKFAAADSTLADFASAYPGSIEALETSYWRALFALDPTNQRAAMAPAMTSLDAYLADTRPRAHVAEAMTLRRVAAQIDALNRLAANAMAQARDASAYAANAKDQATNAKAQASNAKAQASNANARAEEVNATSTSSDAEVKRLRDELAKANSELERIRKKLSQAPPKP
jgi:hypothetical protein